MKVLLGCGYFEPDVGYQEVYYAKWLNMLGHDVTVIAARDRHPSAGKGRYPAGVSKWSSVTVVRPRSIYVGHGMFIISPREVHRWVRQFSPEVAVVFGPGQILPYFVGAAAWQLGAQVTTVFGDSRHYRVRKRGWTRRVRDAALDLAFHTVKAPFYRKAMSISSKVLVTHPEAAEIVEQLCKGRGQRADLAVGLQPLGFDPDVFYFDADERNAVRRQLGLDDDDVALVSATRWTREKRPDLLLEAVAHLSAEARGRLVVVMPGLAAELAASVQAMATSLSIRLTPLPFLKPDELRGVYNGCDLGVWPVKPTATIQEAMGTGLYVLLPNDRVFAHLLPNQGAGQLFCTGSASDMGARIQSVVKNIGSIRGVRVERARRNDWLSYKGLSEKLLP